MSNYIYSPGENAFFAIGLKDSYEAANSWPEDGVAVDDAVASEFMGEPPEGKMRVAGNDGYPIWVDKPEPTYDELVAAADAEKQERIDQANEYMNSKQWPGKAAMGRLKDNEKAQYNAWLDYLDELEAVDTSTAPDITWPTPPAV
ncbi:tail fiber assembly protein [Enterobacter roggenkampii]